MAVVKYVKEYESICPKTKEKVKHTVQYAKATCTRVPDTLLHFSCSMNGSCKECEDDYRE